MKIIKYKKLKDNKYLIEFDCCSVELYEEVILKEELLLKKEIDEKQYKKLLDENKFWQCYYKAIKYINVRSRSTLEVKNKLIKDNFNIDDVSDVINKLLQQGYLNDSVYANSFFNEQLITTSHGPNRIRVEMQKKGIDNSIIDDVLNLYDSNLQYEKASKIVLKVIRSNHSKSNTLLKRKIYSDLMRDGFSKSIIDKVILEQSFLDDNELKNKEYEKLKKRLSKKYEGRELEQKIKEGMFRKGFYSIYD